MNFSFDYVEPDQLTSFRIIPEGEGEFKINDVEPVMSRAGKPQLKIKMTLRSQGQSTSYVLYITNAQAFRIKALCDAIGKPHLYSKAGLDFVQLVGCEGCCVIETEKSDDPQYKDKSVIAKFLESSTSGAVSYDSNELPF